MNFEKRKLQEMNLLGIENISFRDSINQQKLSLRAIKNNLIVKLKRKSIIEQCKSDYNNIPKEYQIQIYKFETSYNTIISYLKSKNNILISYCLNQLCIYFKYNEPNIIEQKLIIEGQFFEILLNLGNIFLNNKNEKDLILVIWILMNIQIYNEGNNDYLNILYGEKYLKFYNTCFTQFGSDEIMNLIIVLLTYLIKLNDEINAIILKSEVFNSIIYYILNKEPDMDSIENSVKLIMNCLNTNFDSELSQKEINTINDIIIILKNELFSSKNEILEKSCYDGLYIISKINNKYKFNEKIIQEGIPLNILKKEYKNYEILKKGLKLLANILTISDKECKIIYENNIIDYYNNILYIYDDDPKLVFIILSSIVNISLSKFRNIIKECIIWKSEKIEKYFNMNDNIKLKFIKIIKYMITNGDYNNLQFIYNTKIIEYVIYLLSSFNLNDKVVNKIIKIVNIYLNKFNDSEKENIEYHSIFNKFQDLIKTTSNKYDS